MKRILILIAVLFTCRISIYSKNTDKSFNKFIEEYNVESVEIIEDEGEFFDDPILKFTIENGKVFCIRHGFAKNTKKLMLYALDDYECYFTIGKSGHKGKYTDGIPLRYLELYFDFKVTGITSIIEHYNEIHEFLETLNLYVLYYRTETNGVYIKHKYNNVCEYPGYLELNNMNYHIGVWDKNRSRIKFEN